MQEKREIVMSGIRPTGFLHLGNYFGAIRNYVAMQDQFECYFMVADLHSLTTHPDTKELGQHVRRVLAENIACGLDPEKSTLFIQSQVPELTELSFYYMNLVTVSRLQRNPTVKNEIKMRNFEASIPVGFFTYPISQAADQAGPARRRAR